MKFKYIKALALSALFIGSQSFANESKETIKVGFEPAFAPFEYIDENSKELVGFDIDLIKAILDDQGYAMDVTTMPFDGLIPALMTGDIDCALAGISINEKRLKRVDFSKPYYDSGLSILIDKKNIESIKTSKDLKGKTVCVQIGTTGAKYAISKLEASEVVQFNTAPESYLELVTGRCVAAINDKPVNDYYLASGKAFKAVHSLDEVLSSESYGIAIAKGNEKIKAIVDTGFENIKKNGEYDRIYDKWFSKK